MSQPFGQPDRIESRVDSLEKTASEAQGKTRGPINQTRRVSGILSWGSRKVRVLGWRRMASPKNGNYWDPVITVANGGSRTNNWHRRREAVKRPAWDGARRRTRCCRIRRFWKLHPDRLIQGKWQIEAGQLSALHYSGVPEWLDDCNQILIAMGDG